MKVGSPALGSHPSIRGVSTARSTYGFGGRLLHHLWKRQPLAKICPSGQRRLDPLQPASYFYLPTLCWLVRGYGFLQVCLAYLLALGKELLEAGKPSWASSVQSPTHLWLFPPFLSSLGLCWKQPSIISNPRETSLSVFITRGDEGQWRADLPSGSSGAPEPPASWGQASAGSAPAPARFTQDLEGLLLAKGLGDHFPLTLNSVCTGCHGRLLGPRFCVGFSWLQLGPAAPGWAYWQKPQKPVANLPCSQTHPSY